MRVKCIGNTGASLPEGVFSYTKNSEFQITVGQLYTVYGIVTFKRFPFYFICEDHYDSLIHKYPMLICSTCFEITDGKISKFWKVKEGSDVYSNNERTIQFGFNEMLNENGFYERLIEGCYEREENIFITMKRAMDNESL